MIRQFLVGGLFTLFAPLLALANTQHHPQSGTIIILDASGSMWGQIDGQNKITIARNVVRDVLQVTTKEHSIGLMAYGHSRRGDCSDIEMLVAPGPGQAALVAAAVDSINPRGKTPLSEAVRQAANALRYDEKAATVILVTDGVETCNADPCSLARDLELSGIDFTTHVVGFGLGQAQGANVSCLASETGGRFFQADDAADLALALSQSIEISAVQPLSPAALKPAPIEKPAPIAPKNNLQINVQITADDPPLQQGQIHRLDLRLMRQSDGKETRLGGNPAQSRSIEPGMYTLSARFEGGQAEMPAEVTEFKVTHATLALNAGMVNIQADLLSQEFALDPSKVSWKITDLRTNKRLDLHAQHYKGVLGAGRYEIAAVYDRNVKMSPPALLVEITAGETQTATVDLPHGRLAVVPVSETGKRLENSVLRYGLWTLKPDGTADRNLAFKAGAKDPTFPLPGEYLLVIDDWGPGKSTKRDFRHKVTVLPGQALDLNVIMPTDPNRPIQISPQ